MNAPRHVYTWQVGRYSACLEVDQIAPGAVNHVHVRWIPHIPEFLSPAEQRAYQQGLIEGLQRAQAGGPSSSCSP